LDSKPQAKLSVNGTIFRHKNKSNTISADWPDFVFEKDIPCCHWKSGKFLLVNKRLTRHPSATEVKEEGVDLGK